MASKKKVITLEISEITIPPRPRALPRKEIAPRIPVIKTVDIQCKRVLEFPSPRLPRQRVMKPMEVLPTSVLVPTLVSLPIPEGRITQVPPTQTQPVEEFHIQVVRPTNRNQAEQFIKEAFEKLSTDVVAILTYIDETTFAHLDLIPKSIGLRILTSVVDDENSVRRAAELQKRSRKSLEVVKLTFMYDDKERPLLHERWLSDSEIFIDFGTDLKTRALGAKQHTIIIDPATKHKSQIDNFVWYWNLNEEKLRQFFNKNVLKQTFFS